MVKVLPEGGTNPGWFEGPGLTGIFAALPDSKLDALLPQEVRGKIGAIMGKVRYPIRQLLFECRLSPADPRIDLAVCLLPRHGEIRNLPTFFPAQDDTSQSLTDPLMPFLKDWASGALSFFCPWIWVAYDFPADIRSMPSPCLSLCLHPGVPGIEPLPSRRIRDIMDECYLRLYGARLESGILSRIEKLESALEGKGIVKHVSFMRSRIPPTLKADCALPVSQVLPFLRDYGWPGPLDEMVQGLSDLVPSGQQLQLNLVLNAGDTDRLEAEFRHGSGPGAERFREKVFAALFALGLCSREKADVLVGLAENPDAGQVGDFRVGAGWYLKIIFAGARPVEAKAYLGFTAKPK